MLARVLQNLQPHLPAHNLGWVFPDETTAALLLGGVGNLVLSYRPLRPVVFISREPLQGEARNPFQQALARRARGRLMRADQLKLDRVFALHFEGESGFVDLPPTRVLFEVTGRNANVLLLDSKEEFSGRILHAAREITASRNRFRTVRTGGLYTPPPPYEKLDPRLMSKEDTQELAGLPIGRWRERVDGLGPLLSAELARRAGLDILETPGKKLPQALAALRSLIEDPSVSEGAMQGGARAAARSEKAAALRKALREPLEKRLRLVTNQLTDVRHAETNLKFAAQDRLEADLLMAYGHTIEPGAELAVLPAFDGNAAVSIALDPKYSALQNAEKLYIRARRREDVYQRLSERKLGLQSEWQEANDQLLALEHASLEDLEGLTKALQTNRPKKSLYGLRFTAPSGLEVLVGRNNKENAFLTHRIGRSLDYWFHAQGYPGSHVLVRAGGRTLDLPDILYAARLAAAYSKARGSGQVPVDYTRIKHVWRPRGAPAGQVHYTAQKTVFVEGALPEGAD